MPNCVMIIHPADDSASPPPSAFENKVATFVQPVEPKVFLGTEVRGQEEAALVRGEGRDFGAAAPGVKVPETGTGLKEDAPSESRRRGDTDSNVSQNVQL
jgi:hypothetical protein